jgi:hypothetical protein
MALRQKSSSNWSDWKLLPMADGTHATGTWNIDISGKANSAMKLEYATCETEAGTSAKVAIIQDDSSFILQTGARVSVKFTNENSAAIPTLNVNDTGAKRIKWRNTNLISTQYWTANQIVDFVYDGTNWIIVGSTNNTIHYYGQSDTSAETTMKTVTVDESFVLKTGIFVTVQFNNKNSASMPTLSVNNTTAYPMTQFSDDTYEHLSHWYSGSIWTFLFNGTYWVSINSRPAVFNGSKKGLVPASDSTTKFLRGDGTWQDISVSTEDTKNTAGASDISSKIFLIGATEQIDNLQTYSHDTAYVGSNGHLYSNSIQVVNLSDTQALTNKTYNGYTLGAACAKSVTDSTSASYIGTGTSLVTERDVYYGLPTINNSHTYTSNTKIYAPLSGGNSGCLLVANGTTSTPTWASKNDLVFTKSGTGAAAGFVPAPSTTAGTTKFLCEDGTWKDISASSSSS